MLRCHSLTYRFSGAARDAVHNVSLVVKPGERLALMGANGSGKSTLARLVAGLLEPNSGAVAIESDAAVTRSDLVGMLFQNPDNQMVSVLVDKEVAFALENRAMPMAEMDQRVRAILSAFEISHLAKRVTSYLSGGEKQRVALASIMIYNPPILLLDEPDSYLDAVGRRILREQLAKLHRDLPDLVEIRVTQYPEVGLTYPRLLLMERGEVVADGSAAEVRANPRFDRLLGRGEVPTEITAAREYSAGGRIRAEKLSFGYGPETPILAGSSFLLEAGESVAIVGATGSGKSTLGLLLAGLIEPDGGAIEIESSEKHQIPIAAVFQQPERQFFLNTVAEEIAFGPKHHGRTLTKEIVARYLDEIGLPSEEFADRDPLTLSMGEKRRLAIGVALALEPSWILFDEPTAGLDPEGVERFMTIARQLKNRGIGLLCISHELKVIEQVAERVLVLDGGTVKPMSTADFLTGRRYRALAWPVRDD